VIADFALALTFALGVQSCTKRFWAWQPESTDWTAVYPAVKVCFTIRVLLAVTDLMRQTASEWASFRDRFP